MEGSHAEGYYTRTEGMYAHAEGLRSKAQGEASHAEGKSAIAEGQMAHAEGFGTYAGADYDENGNYTNFSEDDGVTPVIGAAAHAEGYQTRATGEYSHAEGKQTYAKGNYSHAGGSGSQALGDTTFAIGAGTIARGHNSAAFGSHTIVGKDSDIKVPMVNKDGKRIYLDADNKKYTFDEILAQHAHAYEFEDGVTAYDSWDCDAVSIFYPLLMKTLVYGVNSFVAGDLNEVYGDNSFGIGKANIIDEKSYDTIITGYNNKIENSPYILGAGHNNTIKDAPDAFVSGINNKVSGQAAHVEGMDGEAKG
jgi:hypothetical protein